MPERTLDELREKLTAAGIAHEQARKRFIDAQEKQADAEDALSDTRAEFFRTSAHHDVAQEQYAARVCRHEAREPGDA